MFSFLKRKNKDPRAELRGVLGEYELPTFSGVVMQTLEMLRDPSATPASIAAVLSADPGLSVRVLKTVNSAAYSLRHTIVSLDKAVALLGMSAVESLILSVAVSSALPSGATQGFEATRFWRASARRAATARALATRLHPATAAASFTAALLQDMAVPVLATERSATYGPLLEHWHNSEDDLAALEQAEFGWNHPEVATWMCSEWTLPEEMGASVGAHHGVHNDGNRDLDCPPAVALVSAIRETDDPKAMEQLVEAVRGECGLPADDIVELLELSFDSADDLAHLFVDG